MVNGSILLVAVATDKLLRFLHEAPHDPTQINNEVHRHLVSEFLIIATD